MSERRRHNPVRRGSAYVLVLTLALMVAIVGMGSLGVARVHLRGATTRGQQIEVELLSMSAIEHALSVIEAAADAAELGGTDWRDGFTHGAWSAARDLGAGAADWRLDDATGDEDLGDDPMEPIRLYGRGVVGDAVRVSSVLLTSAGDDSEVLRTALHTAGNLTNEFDLSAAGGPVSVAGALDNYATIDGDVDAGSVGATGTITGTLNVPAPAKAMPSASLFETYRNRATPIGWWDFDGGGGQFEPVLLSAAVNPFGPVNDDGVYRIHVPSWGQLKIRPGRIDGTLVLSADPDAKIKFLYPVLVAPHRPDYPAVLIKGATGVKVEWGWPAGVISEADLGVNLNPSHTPYEGESDVDIADVYAPEVRGLVHIVDAATEVSIGSLVSPPGNLTLTGAFVSEASIVTRPLGSATLAVSPALLTNPPEGYGEGDRVAPMPGSWRWEVVP